MYSFGRHALHNNQLTVCTRPVVNGDWGGEGTAGAVVEINHVVQEL